MLFDYETLKLIWWLLVGALLIGFAIMDGHDMGVCSLLPFVGKDDEERRVIVNTIGPHWEGNQVWFITAGGAIFAAWPLVYATAFSGFYWALIAVLWALFFRPVGFKYRSMISEKNGVIRGIGLYLVAHLSLRWYLGLPLVICSWACRLALTILWYQPIQAHFGHC